MTDRIGTLSPGAHPGGFNGQDAYTGQLAIATFVKAKRAQTSTDDESWNEGGVAPTLNSFDTGDMRATTVAVTAGVRRLTPLECERLQGFPIEWTCARWDFKRQETVMQSDSNRYKQMGNAVAVPVFEWVIGRLVAAHSSAPLTNEEGAA